MKKVGNIRTLLVNIDRRALAVAVYLFIGYILPLADHYFGVSFSEHIWGTPSPYKLEVHRLLLISIFFAMSPLFLFTHIVRCIHQAKQITGATRNIPRLMSRTVLGAISISALPMILYFFVFPEAMWPHNIIYAFALVVVITIWAFYIIDEAVYECENIYEKWSIEALKLLHEDDFRLLIQSLYIVILMMTAGVLSVWLHVLWPSIPEEFRTSLYAVISQAIITFRILYLLVGWISGYAIPILIRLAKIREAVAKRG